MSHEDVVNAAQHCLHNGNRDAAVFLTNTLQHSLQDNFSHSAIVDVIAQATNSIELLWENLTTVHFLLTLLSSFFRRKLPMKLRPLDDKSREGTLLRLLQTLGPRLADVHVRIASSTISPGMVKRMRGCLGDALSMLLLQATHNIVTAASTFCQQYSNDALHLDLLTSAMGILSDLSLQLGPICRSANRLALQKKMDVLLEFPQSVMHASCTLTMCVEFLSNYSTLTPQEQCPAFYDGLARSQLLAGTLSAVASGSEDASQAIALVLASLMSLEDEASADVTRQSMDAALRNGGSRIVSTVFNGVLEGPISDVLLRSELHDLCRWLEEYFLSLARQSSTNDREMLERSVMLLVGGLRPQTLPTIEDDDDEDDMAFVVAEINDMNQRKAASVGRLGDFLTWCTSTMISCGAAAAPCDYDALLDSWLGTDADQWDYDGPESFEGLSRTATVLERLLVLHPLTFQHDSLSGNLLFWGSCHKHDLLRGILAEEILFEDIFGSGVAWYVGQVYRNDASLGEDVWRQLWSLSCRRGFASTALHLLRILKCTPSVTFRGEFMSEFMALLQTFSVAPLVLRRVLMCVHELQALKQAEAPMPILQIWSSSGYGATDVKVCVLICRWASCTFVPHAAIDTCWTLFEEMMCEPSDPLSLFDDDRLWSQLSVLCSSFSAESDEHTDAAASKLGALLQRGLLRSYRDRLLGVANAFCRSVNVRRSLAHAAIGSLCRDAVTAMTSEDPLPLQEMIQACSCAMLFENSVDWFVEFTSWLLQTHQFVSLFSGVALQLVLGLVEGAHEVAKVSQSSQLAPWVRVCDTVVRYTTCTLGGTDGPDDEQDQLRHRCLRAASVFMFDVSSRATPEMMSTVHDPTKSLLEGAEDHHDMLYRLRTLWH